MTRCIIFPDEECQIGLTKTDEACIACQIGKQRRAKGKGVNKIKPTFPICEKERCPLETPSKKEEEVAFCTSCGFIYKKATGGADVSNVLVHNPKNVKTEGLCQDCIIKKPEILPIYNLAEYTAFCQICGKLYTIKDIIDEQRFIGQPETRGFCDNCNEQ